jgi:hypothetical protein
MMYADMICDILSFFHVKINFLTCEAQVKKFSISAVVSLFFVSNLAVASVCDYRPSQLIGGTATGAVAGTSGTAAATGIGLKAAGIYAITNATTGAAMLGSTAAGASAAGTAGIIAGSAGFIGTAGAVLMSPLVIIPATVAAVGIGAFEGGYYIAK